MVVLGRLRMLLTAAAAASVVVFCSFLFSNEKEVVFIWTDIIAANRFF